MDFSSCTVHNMPGKENEVLMHLQTATSWDKIPLLNANELHDMKEGSLVRFCGMVQDMYTPEYYLEKYIVLNKLTNEKLLKNGKYLDAVIAKEHEEIDFDNEQNVTAERQTYVVISMPGINDWVKDIESSKFKVENQMETASGTTQCKRSYEEAMESEQIPQESTSTNDQHVSQEKKSSTNTSQSNQHADEVGELTVSREHILNFPLPNRTGKACHLKVYKDTELLKLNQMYEFVGYLTADPVIESLYEGNDLQNKMEIQTHHPPSSLVPRIHCITFRPLRHNNPLVNKDEVMDTTKVISVYKDLLVVLTQLLLGDELAAEYLIYHLISEIYLRRDFMPLGKFSLNIYNVPKLENVDYVSELYKFVEMLVPKSHYLPMTLENMNELAFVPKKDYECDRLTSGILQLSANTHVLLDETKLTAGKLESSGISGLRAIQEVIKNQKLTYDFNYYPIEYDCDIPFLIMSEGKSMLTTDTTVVLRPDDTCLNTFCEIVQAAKHFLKPELLNDIRKYLTMARMVQYDISEKAQDLIQQEFVEMRQKDNATADDLHCLLVLARLVCVSRGKTTLDDQCWKHACDLERQRKARLPK